MVTPLTPMDTTTPPDLNIIREALLYGQQARPRSPLFDRALAALTSLSAAPQGVVKKPKCPHCGSTNLFMFDSDNDICGKCEKYFPAVLPATLILGNGFSEETVRKMLEEFIAQSENASEIDWLKQCAAKYGIEL